MKRGKPEARQRELETVPGKPRTVLGKDLAVLGKPETVQGGFKTLPGKPAAQQERLEALPGKPRALSATFAAIVARLGRERDESRKIQTQFGVIDGRLDAIAAQLDAIHGQLKAIPARLDTINAQLRVMPGGLGRLPGEERRGPGQLSSGQPGFRSRYDAGGRATGSTKSQRGGASPSFFSSASSWRSLASRRSSSARAFWLPRFRSSCTFFSSPSVFRQRARTWSLELS
jgi:hypothetical protein